MPADSHIHFLPRNSPSTSAGKSTVTQAAKPGMQEPAPLPRLYREVYKASGLSRMEIRSRLAWSNNASKMLRLLDFLLEGKCPDPEFEQRFIKVMEIPHDVLARVRQQQAEWENRRNEEKLAAQVKREFIGYGSRLVVLPNRDYKPQTFFGRWGMHLGCRLPLDMAYYPDNQPPTREDMARCIASMDPSLKAMLPLPVHMIGGFIYYRLPGETWSFDVNGNLAGYGDTHAVLPEGSWMI